MKFTLSRTLLSCLGLGLILVSVSCTATGKLKDEGAYTTGAKPAPGRENKASGTVGVYTEVGGSSKSVR